MKNKKLKRIGVVVLLAVTVVACVVFFIHKNKADRFEAVILDVSTSTVKQTLSTQGVVESTNRGEFEIFEGVVVKEVFVKLGDKVEEGRLTRTVRAKNSQNIARINGKVDVVKYGCSFCVEKTSVFDCEIHRLRPPVLRIKIMKKGAPTIAVNMEMGIS